MVNKLIGTYAKNDAGIALPSVFNSLYMVFAI